jgi:hypothetical protein
VVDRVQTTVAGEDDVRFALYSGHDNTLSPFLSAFNVFDARQPPMASGSTRSRSRTSRSWWLTSLSPQ